VPGNAGGTGRPTNELRQRFNEFGSHALEDLGSMLISGEITTNQKLAFLKICGEHGLSTKVLLTVQDADVYEAIPGALHNALSDLDDATAMRIVDRFLDSLQSALRDRYGAG